MLRVRGIPTVSNVFYSIQSSDVDFGGSAVDIYNVALLNGDYNLVTAAGDELVCVDIGHT